MSLPTEAPAGIFMTAAPQFELFPEMLKGLPKREKTRWEELREMQELTREKGALLPRGTAAEILDVSRQRVDELIKAGRIELFKFLGKSWVCESDLLRFAKSERTCAVRYGKK